jgi:hypothetical protein
MQTILWKYEMEKKIQNTKLQYKKFKIVFFLFCYVFMIDDFVVVEGWLIYNMVHFYSL